MTELTKLNYIRCELCQARVERGVFNMIEHYEDVHGLKDKVNFSIAFRQAKGSRLEEIDLEELLKPKV
jgi:hypothetical protein